MLENRKIDFFGRLGKKKSIFRFSNTIHSKFDHQPDGLMLILLYHDNFTQTSLLLVVGRGRGRGRRRWVLGVGV